MTEKPLLDPMIFEMKKTAEAMIKCGNDHGLLALFWINRWIKDPSITLDEDLYDQGIKKEVATSPHPDNFSWRFNAPELAKGTRSYYAISKAYCLSGGKL